MKEPKPISVNPLKTSPALGAAYALQGIKGAIPLFHSAPGCAFLGKVLLTQHLREPVGLLGTDIKEMPTIMGGWDELKKRISDVHEKFKPSLIGVIGTALSEVRGEDIEAVLSSEFGVRREKKQMLLSQNSKLETLNSKLVYIPVPDYIGGFSEGYGIAVKTIVENFAMKGPKILRQINLLPSPSLTIGDIEEIKDITSAFNLKSIILPDLSLSMDGSKDRFSNLPLNGATVEDIALMGRSSATIAIGEGAREAGEALIEHFEIPLYFIKSITGLEATDNFITLLSQLCKMDVPPYLRRWRKRLVDGMVDTHLIMANKKVGIGIDGDMLTGITAFCKEMGMDVIPPHPPLTKGGNGGICDLEDLEDMAQDADIIISNSHGKEISERLGIPLLRMGFPVYDRFGETLKTRVGYKGSLNLLFEMANIFQEVLE